MLDLGHASTAMFAGQGISKQQQTPSSRLLYDLLYGLRSLALAVRYVLSLLATDRGKV